MELSRDQALKIFKLQPTATAEEIEQRFKDLASKTHPDHGGTTEQFADVVAARDCLLRTTPPQGLVPRPNQSLATADIASSSLITVERERDIQRRRAEKSERVAKGVVRTEVNRLTRSRRTAHLLAWLGGGAGAVTLALRATTLQGATAVENQWIAQIAIAGIVLGALCAIAGFLISGQITRIEQAAEDAAEAMTDRSTFLNLLYEVVEPLEDEKQTAWTSEELLEAIEEWAPRNATYSVWRRRLRSYGKGFTRILNLPKEIRRWAFSLFAQLDPHPALADLSLVVGAGGFLRLLIAKGEETGLLLPKEELDENRRLVVQHRLALELAEAPDQPMETI